MLKYPDNTIIIEPWGGLCNRMRALDSAMQLANDLNKNLHVLWYTDATLNCNFDQLFEIPKHIKSIEQISLHKITGRNHKRFNKYIYPLIMEKHLKNDEVLRLLQNKYDFKSLTTYQNIYISSFLGFYHQNKPYKSFTPTSSLKNEIDNHLKTFSSNAVGVHIRRTDNIKSIKHSPIRSFIRQMEKELTNNSDTIFYLATDSPNVEHDLHNRFPGKIIIHSKKSLDRNNPDAIKDAVIDLYCLASTKKIIGSYWSSFSDTAASINGVEKITIYEE